MAGYAGAGTRTSAAGTTVLAVYAPAASMRRASIYDFEIKCNAGPTSNDNEYTWDITRTSTVGTIGSSVTPNPLDSADAAAVTLMAQAHSAEPTLGAVLKQVGLNQRATFRWMAFDPAHRLVIPATANNGIALRTSASGAALSVLASVEFDE
jgi:hypothetical protein